MHHVLVLSPEGPYLLKLLENFHNLIPYTMIRQTLRVGNAATMINGMVRLLLAKMGVGALSNWVGLTQNADDGMNLLQKYGPLPPPVLTTLTASESSPWSCRGTRPSFANLWIESRERITDRPRLTLLPFDSSLIKPEKNTMLSGTTA